MVIVIISFHGGAEGSKYEHVPREHEMFVGEDRGDVYQFAHAVIDAGADVVLGHGPHVTRAIEVYKEINNIPLARNMWRRGDSCTEAGIAECGESAL